MANGQNMTAEEFTTSVAEAIAAQLKIDASALVTRLVDSLSKGLIKEFTKKGPLLAEKQKPSETSKATKQDSTKLPKIELALPKIIETQIGKLDDINKSLSKLIDKTATVKKEDQLPGLLKKLVPKESAKPEVPKPDTSFNVLGNTFQKILNSFKTPSVKQEVVAESPKIEALSKKEEPVTESPKAEAPSKPDTSLNVLGGTLQKILNSFKAPSVKQEVVTESSKIEAPSKPDTSLNVLGGTLQKILNSFKAPSVKQEVQEPLKSDTSFLQPTEGASKETPKAETKQNTSTISILGGTLQKLVDNFKVFFKKEETSKKDVAKPEAPKSLLEQKVEAQPVIIAGLSESGIKDLSAHLPDIIKEGIKDLIEDAKQKKEKKEVAGGGGLLSLLPKGLLAALGMAGGGLALLLGGVAALVTGLMTDGPFKGLLKILSKVGISGGLKLLEKGATTFLKSLDKFIKAPAKLMTTAYKALRGIFGKGMSKTIAATVGKTAGLFTKMAAGFLKFLAPILKKLPLIGTVISLGFAYTRFKSGDTVGGIIDVLSGIANAFAIVPGFGLIGSGIAIGLDVLNAFLDAKTGGASPEASKKKLNILGDMAKWLGEKLINVPMIGPLIKAGKHFFAKEWMKGLKQLAYISPVMEFIGAMLGDTETSTTMQGAASGAKSLGGSIKDWASGLMDYALEKITAAFGWVGKIGAAIADKKWGEAFIEIGKIIPGMDWLVGMLGGEEKVAEAGNAAGEKTFDLLTAAKDFVMEKINKALGWIGKIGDAIKSEKWGDAFIEISKFIPGLSWVVGLVGGDQAVAEAGNAVGEKTFDIFKSIKDALLNKLEPVFGKFISIGKKFDNKDPLGGIAELCKLIPGLGWLGDILDSDTTKMEFKANVESGNAFKSITDVFGDVSKSILKMFLDNALSLIPPTILGFPLQALVAQKLGLPIPPGAPTELDNKYLGAASGIAALTGYDEKAAKDSIKTQPQLAETPQKQPQPAEVSPQIEPDKDQVQPLPTGTVVEPTVGQQLSDAGVDSSIKSETVKATPADAVIDPSGGLIVSSPTEGSLFQLSKNDGIVAAPVAEDSSNPTGAASFAATSANIGNSDKILTTIAMNTEATNKNLAGLANGFNALAKSLEKLGSSVANQSPTVVNNIAAGSKGSSPKVSASQIASAGNSTISKFRAGVEASRFVPA